jgi:uncharacterized protein (DUF305 family)
MRRNALLALAAVAATAVLAGCGGSHDADHTSTGHAMSGDADVPFDRMFIDAMIPHHESAIAMAEEAKAAGLSDPKLVDIADNIIASQRSEIDRMRDWRQAWFGSSSTLDPDAATQMGLNHEQMGTDGLDLSNGADVNGAFAEAMTVHHEGAIRMAEMAIEQAEHPELRDLAKRIIQAQRGEIAIMQAGEGD